MEAMQGFASLLARVALASVFFARLALHHLPYYGEIIRQLDTEGVPLSGVSHAIAIGLMIIGGVSLALGWFARFGATMLIAFLALSAYYIHDFWAMPDPYASEDARFHLLKNIALAGSMLFIIANGPGAWSIDGPCYKTTRPPESLPG